MSDKKHTWKPYQGTEYSAEEYYKYLQPGVRKDIKDIAKQQDIDELQCFNLIVKTGIRQLRGLGNW